MAGELDHQPDRSARRASGLGIDRAPVTFNWSLVVEEIAGLKAAIAERDTRLLEAQHRARNSLQMIVGLLDRQSRMLADPVGRAAFDTVINEVVAIGMVDDVLASSASAARGDLRTLLTALCRHLTVVHRSRLAIDLDLGTVPCMVDHGAAERLSIIVNEMVVNAAKHAFPAGRRGTVTIRLARAPDSHVLTVADDGVGVRPGAGTGTGQTLIDQLTSALGGIVDRTSSAAGACFTITFPATV